MEVGLGSGAVGVHGHDDVEEALLEFFGFGADDAGAEGVEHFEDDLVVVEVAEGVHEEFGAEADGDGVTLEGGGEGFLGFADFGCVELEFELIGGEGEADGVDAFGIHEGDAMDGFEEFFAFEFCAVF